MFFICLFPMNRFCLCNVRIAIALVICATTQATWYREYAFKSILKLHINTVNPFANITFFYMIRVMKFVWEFVARALQYSNKSIRATEWGSKNSKKVKEKTIMKKCRGCNRKLQLFYGLTQCTCLCVICHSFKVNLYLLQKNCGQQTHKNII